MRYVLAVLMPPVVFFTIGKPFQGILNLILMFTLLGWPLAAIWALVVVAGWKTEQGQKKVIAELQRSTAALEAQNAALAAQVAATRPDGEAGTRPGRPTEPAGPTEQAGQSALPGLPDPAGPTEPA